MRPRAPQPNPQSSLTQKHINSDWVRVWAVRSASLRATPLSPLPPSISWVTNQNMDTNLQIYPQTCLGTR